MCPILKKDQNSIAVCDIVMAQLPDENKKHSSSRANELEICDFGSVGLTWNRNGKPNWRQISGLVDVVALDQNGNFSCGETWRLPFRPSEPTTITSKNTKR